MSLQSLFSSLLVIETATILAGPSVGMFLAELGATVIKVEDKNRGGDTTRSWKLKTEDQDNDICAYFASINWGKHSIALNLRNPTDKKILNDLLDKADIWLQNFRPAQQAKLGLTFEELSARNPKLIVGQVLAFQAGDPRPGFDAA
ncbi:MAG: CoA transferase, partial [Chloroflexota bacterium]